MPSAVVRIAPSFGLFATRTVPLPEPAPGEAAGLAAEEALAAGDAAGLADGLAADSPIYELFVDAVAGAVETPAPLVDADVAVDDVDEPQAASMNASSNPTLNSANVDRGFIRGLIPSPLLIELT
jgi:hypothetical protein